MRISQSFLAVCSSGAFLAMSVALASPAMAATQSHATLYVNVKTGSNLNAGTIKAPLASIQAAVNKASAGTTIVVEPGTYKEMVTVTKRVVIESQANVGNAQNTVIDAQGKANGILIKGTLASGTTVHGLGIEDANDAGILAVGPISNLTFSANFLAYNSQVKPPKTVVDWETLHLEGATHSRIINNDIVDNLDGGIYLTDEPGPSAYNLVEGNLVVNNQIDCGITLASHVKGHGVYDNQVIGNISEHNGAAGVILATPVPGGIVRDNLIKDNTVKFNGLGGIGLHTHAPGSIVANNKIVDNVIGDNSADLSGSTVVSTGIDVSAVGSPITGTMIAQNKIFGEADAINATSMAEGTVIKGNVGIGVNSVTHVSLPLGTQK